MIPIDCFNHKLQTDRFTLLHYLDVGHFYATMTRTEAIKIARVDRSTFQRWERGLVKPPAATLELLRMYAYGEPPSYAQDWTEWRFKNGKLINNSYGYEFTPYDLKAVIYWQPYANKLQGENTALKMQLDAFKARN